MSRKPRLTLAIALLVLTGTSLVPVLARDDHKGKEDKTGNVIDFLKSYPVSKIDTNLPDIPFEKWLKSAIGDTPLEWKENGCAGHDPDIDECTSFSVTVRTPEGRCPSIGLNFAVEKLDFARAKHVSVYLLQSDSLAKLEKSLSEVKSKKATSRMSGKDMIEYVRALDVHRLDPSLPSERFDKWIERSARWPIQWWDSDLYSNLYLQCELKRLMVRVTPAGMHDPEARTTPFDIYVDIGTWGRGIEGEPKLIRITFLDPKHWGEYTRSYQDSQTHEKNLSALQKKFDEWSAALLTRKPRLSVVKNMTTIGSFNRVKSTATGHCSGHSLDLWQYGGRTFGLHHRHDGLCGDPPCSALQEVKFNPKTGDLEFLSYLHGWKYIFAGNVEQDAVVGNFTTSATNGRFTSTEAVKLMRDKDRPLDLEHERNVVAWCKAFKPLGRCSGVEDMCKSMGVE